MGNISNSQAHSSFSSSEKENKSWNSTLAFPCQHTGLCSHDDEPSHQHGKPVNENSRIPCLLFSSTHKDHAHFFLSAISPVSRKPTFDIPSCFHWQGDISRLANPGKNVDFRVIVLLVVPTPEPDTIDVASFSDSYFVLTLRVHSFSLLDEGGCPRRGVRCREPGGHARRAVPSPGVARVFFFLHHEVPWGLCALTSRPARESRRVRAFAFVFAPAGHVMECHGDVSRPGCRLLHESTRLQQRAVLMELPGCLKS